MDNVTDHDDWVIKVSMLIAVTIISVAGSALYFSGDILRWFELPYKVQHELDLRGHDWSDTKKVSCSLKPGDEVHHVGRGSWRQGKRFQLYRVVLKDPLASGCYLDLDGILVEDYNIKDAIERDRYLALSKTKL